MDAELAAHWLARDCTVTDQDLFEKTIRDRGDALEPLFVEAFLKGPPQSEMDTLFAAIEVRYARRQQRITAGQAYHELAGESLSLADEKQQAKDAFEQGYKAAALNGLRIIGKPEGRRLLQDLSMQDSASPYQYLAKLLLQR
jgi:hypothetical protein